MRISVPILRNLNGRLSKPDAFLAFSFHSAGTIPEEVDLLNIKDKD